MPSLRLEGIRKTFRDVVALDRIDLEVEDGEYVVILGPTGAGKTTLLKIIAGLLRQDVGHVYLDGSVMDHLPPEERRIAYLPQTYSLFSHLTVWENAIFGPTVQGWPPGRVERVGREMLDLVRLFDRRYSYPRELSGGMQQRVALCRALTANADILLLDEPLRALDARLRIELRRELKDLADHLGITTLHVTHDQEEALSVADRILVLRKGRVRQIGSPRDVYEKPSDPFVAHFVGEANFFEGTVVDVEGDAAYVQLRDGLRLAATSSEAKVGDAVILGVKVDRCVLSADGNGENSLEATIRRILFAGKRTTFEVSLDGLGKAKVKMPSAKAEGLKEGQRLCFSFPREFGMVFPPPSGGLREALEVE
ncbi:MAG: ABC transporter ATP-binding protein [Thermoplasmata archaeon]